MLSPDDPDMPTLQSMHKMIAQSPRAQSKFFFLMDDIVDIYLMGFDQSFYGRHHVQQSFQQERGFQHGHRKQYVIPHTKERLVIDFSNRRTKQCCTAC